MDSVLKEKDNEIETLKKEIQKLSLDRNSIVKFVIDELIKRSIIKPNMDLKEKTKILLKNYNKFKKSIKFCKVEIEKLEASKNTIGGPRMNRNTNFDEVGYNGEITLDIINSRIIDLEQTIIKIKCFLTTIEKIVDSLKEEESELLRRIYFNKENVNDIADEMNCDPSTLYKKISTAVNEIKVILFANDYINNMFY